jgi:hypothetical protein
LFATAGALSLDATSFGAVDGHSVVGGLTGHVAGAFAALLTFYLALRLPLGVLAHLRGVLGGISSPTRAASTGGGGGRGVGVRVSDTNARLRAGTLQAGRVAGLAAGALGAPAGGLVGAGVRRAGRLRAPVASTMTRASAPFSVRARDTHSLLSTSRMGQSLARSSRARKMRNRVKASGRVLSESPGMVRDAAVRKGAKTDELSKQPVRRGVEDRGQEAARRAPKSAPQTGANAQTTTDRDSKPGAGPAKRKPSRGAAQGSSRRQSGSGSRNTPLRDAPPSRPKETRGASVASKPRSRNQGSSTSPPGSSSSAPHGSVSQSRKQGRVERPVSGVPSTSSSQRKPNRKPNRKPRQARKGDASRVYRRNRPERG